MSLTHKTTLGRTRGDLVIEDPKLSSLHAFFDYDPSLGWSVVDGGSRNGVWVNGHKELKSILKDGDRIQVGSSQIQCRVQAQGQFQVSENFLNWLQSLTKKLKPQKSPLVEVKPEIRLKVIRGLQYGETWEIFYGPRRAGRESLDICLYDDQAPKDSFEILVKGKYAYFHTDHQDIVKINKQSLSDKQFAPGDVISFGESEILVEFDEGHGFSS